MLWSVTLWVVIVTLTLTGCQSPPGDIGVEAPSVEPGGSTDPQGPSGTDLPERIALSCATELGEFGYVGSSASDSQLPHEEGGVGADATVVSNGVASWVRAAEPADRNGLFTAIGKFCLEYVPWGSEPSMLVNQVEPESDFLETIDGFSTEKLFVESVAGSPNSAWLHVTGRNFLLGFPGSEQHIALATHLVVNVETGEWSVPAIAVPTERADEVFHLDVSLARDGAGGVIIETSQHSAFDQMSEPSTSELIRFENTGPDAVEMGRMAISLSRADRFELHVNDSASQAVIVVHPGEGERDEWRYIFADFDALTVVESSFTIPGFVPYQVAVSPELDAAYLRSSSEETLDELTRLEENWYSQRSVVHDRFDVNGDYEALLQGLEETDLDFRAEWDNSLGRGKPERVIAYSFVDGVAWHVDLPGTGLVFGESSSTTRAPLSAPAPTEQGAYVLLDQQSPTGETWRDEPRDLLYERVRRGESIPSTREYYLVSDTIEPQQVHKACALDVSARDGFDLPPDKAREAMFFHEPIAVLPTDDSSQFYVMCMAEGYEADGYSGATVAYLELRAR